MSGCPCRHLSPLILGKAEVSSYRSRTHPKPGFIPEIIITASGENVSPGPIENMIKKKIPILSHAMLVGDKAKFLSILLTLKVMGSTAHPAGPRGWPGHTCVSVW